MKSQLVNVYFVSNQLGNNAVIATQNKCVAKGQETVSYVTAKRWVKRFRNGDFSWQDDLRSGRHMEINLAKLKHVDQIKTLAILQLSLDIFLPY